MSDTNVKKEVRHDLGGCVFALKMLDKILFDQASVSAEERDEAREMLKITIDKIDKLMKKLA